jgi:rhodanese-related sulfurtransferase
MRLRSLCIFLMMAAAAMPTPGQQLARRLTPEQVFARMMSGERVVFVDARSIFTGPMIAGAVRVPGDQLEAWAKTTSKDALVVAYCTCPAEHTAANHVVQLQKYGFTNAYALLGGLSAWEAAGLPTALPPAERHR